MPILVTVERYYGRFPPAPTNFANQGALDSFLQSHGITMSVWMDIVTELGYANQSELDTALENDLISGEDILDTLEEL